MVRCISKSLFRKMIVENFALLAVNLNRKERKAYRENIT
jgi:hypothetical protein